VTDKCILKHRLCPYLDFASVTSVPEAEQVVHTPRRGEPESSQEGYTDEMIRRCAFAPALEHGDQSNDK
jgi:hypothetical protein